MSKELRRGAMYNYLNLILIIVSGAVLTPFIMRSLGPSQYGLYLLIGSLTPYFTLLDIGMGKTITRYVAHYRARHDEVGEAQFLTTCSRIYIGITALVIAVGVVLYCNVEHIWGVRFTPGELDDVRLMIMIVAIAHAIIIPGNAFTAICNGCGEFAFTRGILPIKYIVRIVGVIILLLCGQKAVAMIALESILTLIMTIATYIYVKMHIGRKHIGASTAHPYLPVLQYARWIALYSTIYALQWNIAPLIASTRCDAATVGVIGVGILIGNIYGYFAETINKMMMPQASLYVKEWGNNIDVTTEMSRVGRIIALPQLLILGGFIIFGREFVELWAGDGYEQAYYVALIMMTSWSLQQSQDYGNSLLEAKGETRYMSIINFTAITAGIIASYFVGQQYGIIGITASLGVGTIAATTVSNIYYKRKLKLNIMQYIGNVYARPVTIAAALILLFRTVSHIIPPLPDGLWLVAGGIVYICVYAVVTYRWALNEQEKAYIREKCKR